MPPPALPSKETLISLQKRFEDLQATTQNQDNSITFEQKVVEWCERASRIVHGFIKNGHLHSFATYVEPLQLKYELIWPSPYGTDPPEVDQKPGDYDELWWLYFLSYLASLEDQAAIVIPLQLRDFMSDILATNPHTALDELPVPSSEFWAITCELSCQGLDYLIRLSDSQPQNVEAAQVPGADSGLTTDDLDQELQRCEQKAYESYQFAVEKMGETGPTDVTDMEAYTWLGDHLDSLYEYDLPALETWQRYVRAGRKFYGTQKNQPRHGRDGRSIVRQSEIDIPDDDT